MLLNLCLLTHLENHLQTLLEWTDLVSQLSVKEGGEEGGERGRERERERGRDRESENNMWLQGEFRKNTVLGKALGQPPQIQLYWQQYTWLVHNNYNICIAWIWSRQEKNPFWPTIILSPLLPPPKCIGVTYKMYMTPITGRLFWIIVHTCTCTL